MSRTDHAHLMANYNEWMNAKLYDAAMRLSDEQIAHDNKAFFGSILGTLNHLVVTDTIWLKRIATHPANFPQLIQLQDHATPTSLDQILYKDIRSLWSHRKLMDAIILKWAKEITEPDLDQLLHYKNV